MNAHEVLRELIRYEREVVKVPRLAIAITLDHAERLVAEFDDASPQPEQEDR